MTQLPVGDSPPSPRGASWRDTRIGDYDATYLKDSENNTHMLFTWAFQQNLLFEARLDTLTKKELRQFASAAYEGLRQSTPLGCDDERSDLAPESLVAQLGQHDYRMFLDDGCPVRLEVAAIGAFAADHHCWPGVENGRLGDSHFWKDPAGELDRPQVTERFKDETERKTAIAAYYALCSWVDHNVGRVLDTLGCGHHDGRVDGRAARPHGGDLRDCGRHASSHEGRDGCATQAP